MRRMGLALVIFLGLALSSPASAQFVISGPGGGGPGGMARTPKFTLFMDPAVRKELKLTQEQDKKVTELLEEMQQGGLTLGGGGGGEAKVTFRIAGGQGVPAGPISLPDFKKIEGDLMKVLDDKQKARVKQIWLQRTGLMALSDSEIAKEVGLEEPQKDLVKDILEDHQKETQRVIQEALAEAGGAGGAIKFDAKKMKGLHEKAEKSLKEILSQEQDAKWQEMLGPKFEGKKAG